MTTIEEQPRLLLRIVGAAFAFFVFVVALVAILGAMDSLGVNQETILFIGKGFTYTGFGVTFVGWKWPRQILAPVIFLARKVFRKSSDNGNSTIGADRGRNLTGVARTLEEPIQRGLFAAACMSLVPWVCMRLIREIGRSSDIKDYLHSVFLKPISPWFESGWWWYTRLEWYDWPVLPAVLAISLAFSWPYTGARIFAWVRNPK
jgi:hypothetical protein